LRQHVEAKGFTDSHDGLAGLRVVLPAKGGNRQVGDAGDARRAGQLNEISTRHEMKTSELYLIGRP